MSSRIAMRPTDSMSAIEADWIAQHFFTGGIMPSRGLMHHFPDLFTVAEEWNWSGTHYERTAEDWLRNFDAHRAADPRPCWTPVYGRGGARLGAAVAVVLPGDGGTIRPCRRGGMGRHALPADARLRA